MPLNHGDLMFVGWDTDNNDISFIATTQIAAGEVIYFTGDKWDGTSFNGGAQYMEWTAPTGGVPSGTIVTIDMDNNANTATIDAGGALDCMRGGYSPAGGNEMFWAFQGTRTGTSATPTDFIAVIGNELSGNYNQSPNLSGTGLTTSNGAIIIDGDENYMEWTDDSALTPPIQQQDLIDTISNTSNWTTADRGGSQNPIGGSNVVDQTVVRFVKGTKIMTPAGEVAIENLRAGDLVQTWQGPSKPITRIIETKATPASLLANAKLAPILIDADAFGPGNPTRELRLSRQHRVLVRSKIAQRMFDESEVLVPAIRLLALDGVRKDTAARSPTYYHLVLDQHELVIADGCPTESLYLGPDALKAMPSELKDEIVTLFGAEIMGKGAVSPVRHVPAPVRQKRLIERLRKNAKPLVDAI